MKIIAPVDRPEEVTPLVEAGADELFCGLASERWLAEYTIAAVSRRSGRIASVGSLERLEQTVSRAHAAGVPVCLAVNEHYYTAEQYPLLFEYLGLAAGAGVDSVIVADPALVLAIRKAGLGVDVHLSTGTAVLNSETAKLFQDLGVTRVTLERQQTIAEVAAVVRNLEGLETAVFVLNGRCPNVDGLCTYDHVQIPGEAYKNACMVACRVRCRPEPGAAPAPGGEEYAEVTPLVRQKVWERYHMDDSPCGACALHDFAALGVSHLKIVGRGNPTPRKLADVRFVRSLATLAEAGGLSRSRFLDAARMLRGHTYHKPCRAVGCYYPEVLSAGTAAS